MWRGVCSAFRSPCFSIKVSLRAKQIKLSPKLLSENMRTGAPSFCSCRAATLSKVCVNLALGLLSSGLGGRAGRAGSWAVGRLGAACAHTNKEGRTQPAPGDKDEHSTPTHSADTNGKQVRTPAQQDVMRWNPPFRHCHDAVLHQSGTVLQSRCARRLPRRPHAEMANPLDVMLVQSVSNVCNVAMNISAMYI